MQRLFKDLNAFEKVIIICWGLVVLLIIVDINLAHHLPDLLSIQFLIHSTIYDRGN